MPMETEASAPGPVEMLKILSETGMPVIVAVDALSCVGEGTGKSLENMNLLKRVVMTSKKLKQ